MRLPVLIYIFSQIAGMSPDPSTLVKNAACLNCIPPGVQMSVLMNLAAQIIAGGGGGASGVGPPTYTPSGIATLVPYKDIATGNLYWWDPTDGWVPPVP